MTKSFKLLFLSGLLFIIVNNAFSQLSVSYYSSSLSKIGVGYEFGDRFWGEFRLYNNTSINDITPELVFCYDIVDRERHDVYLGFGGNVNYFTGFVLPVGVQFIPVEDFERFSLHIELQPSLDIDGDLIPQGSWGIRYRFGDR